MGGTTPIFFLLTVQPVRVFSPPSACEAVTLIRCSFQRCKDDFGWMKLDFSQSRGWKQLRFSSPVTGWDSTHDELGAALDACCITECTTEDATHHLEKFTSSSLQQTHVMCAAFPVIKMQSFWAMTFFPGLLFPARPHTMCWSNKL